MTDKTTAALKLAEEAMTSNMRLLGAKALAAIREALAEQDKQEPVAVISESAIGLVKLHSNGACLPFGTQLYAAPVSVEAAVLAEREACAKVCAQLMTPWDENTPNHEIIALRNDGMRQCAAAIRARAP